MAPYASTILPHPQHSTCGFCSLQGHLLQPQWFEPGLNQTTGLTKKWIYSHQGIRKRAKLSGFCHHWSMKLCCAEEMLCGTLTVGCAGLKNHGMVQCGPERLQEHLDNTVRHRVGFLDVSCAGPGVGLQWSLWVPSSSGCSVILWLSDKYYSRKFQLGKALDRIQLSFENSALQKGLGFNPCFFLC